MQCLSVAAAATAILLGGCVHLQDPGAESFRRVPFYAVLLHALAAIPWGSASSINATSPVLWALSAPLSWLLWSELLSAVCGSDHKSSHKRALGLELGLAAAAVAATKAQLPHAVCGAVAIVVASIIVLEYFRILVHAHVVSPQSWRWLLKMPAYKRSSSHSGISIGWHSGQPAPQGALLLRSFIAAKAVQVLVSTWLACGGGHGHLNAVSDWAWAASAILSLHVVPQAMLVYLAMLRFSILARHQHYKLTKKQRIPEGPSASILQEVLSSLAGGSPVHPPVRSTSDSSLDGAAADSVADSPDTPLQGSRRSMGRAGIVGELYRISEEFEPWEMGMRDLLAGLARSSSLRGVTTGMETHSSRDSNISAISQALGLATVAHPTVVEAGTQCELLPATQPLSQEPMPPAEVPPQPPAAQGAEATKCGIAGLQQCVNGGAGQEVIITRSRELEVLRGLLATLQEHAGDIAHDMKNPLNGVLALSQTVQQGTLGELPTAASEQLNVVRACAYHLLNMISMLRDLLKSLNNGDLELHNDKCLVQSPLEEVLSRLRPMAGNRLTINLVADPTRAVIADDQRLYQVLHLTIANAVKYTRRGSVTINTQLSPDGKYCTVRVEDTGPGISQELLQRFNAPLTGSASEQMGLGLAMVKRLMAGFGGALRIRTKAGGEEGQGSVVELVFRAERDAPTLSELPHPTASSRNSVDLAALAPASTTKPAPGSEHQVKPVQPPQSPQQAQPQSSSLPRPATALEASPSSSAPILPAPPAASLLHATTAAQQPGNEETPAPSAVEVLARPRPDPPGASTDTPQANSMQALAQVRLSEASRTGFEQSEQLGETEAGVILIVDDDPLNLDILEDLLTPAGYTILTAASGNEALEVFVSADPPVQLVLLDVTLPDLSGHEVCTKMRSLSPGVPPPIIMISGKASTKDVVKGLQAGSSDYITKPFQPQEVLARVETQLRLYTGDLQALQETAERNIELLKQVLPPHILEPLRGGSRVLMEKFPEVCVLQAEIVGFSMLAAQSDTPDCILTLSRIYSLFDQLVDKHALHKADSVGEAYCVAVGHVAADHSRRTSVGMVAACMELAQDMLEVVRTLDYPDTLGKMELRLGLHVGPVYAGVLGVKFPRYCFFGTTQRLATALTALALPMTLHVSEAVYNRVHATLGGEMNLIPYTLSSFQGMGIIRTFLVPMACVDAEALASCSVADTMTRINAGQAAAGLQVMQTMMGSRSSNIAGASTSGVQHGLPLPLTSSLPNHVFLNDNMPRHRASSNTGAMSVMLGQEAPLDVSGRTMPSSVGLQGQGQGEPAQQQGKRLSVSSSPWLAGLDASALPFQNLPSEPPPGMETLQHPHQQHQHHHQHHQSPQPHQHSHQHPHHHPHLQHQQDLHTGQHPQRPSPSPQGPSSVTLPPPSTLTLGTCWEAGQPPDLTGTQPSAPHTHLHLTPPVIHRVRGTPARNSSDVSVDVGAAFGSMVQSRGTGAGNASAEDGCALSSHSSSPARLAAPDAASVATNADLQPHPNQHQADGPPPYAGGAQGQDAGGGPGGVRQQREAAWDTLEPRLLHDLGLSPTSARPLPLPLTQPAWSTSSGPAACSLAAAGQPAGPARSLGTSPAPASVALQPGPGSSSSLASDAAHAGSGDGVQGGRMLRKGSSAAGESLPAAAAAQSAPPAPAAGPAVTAQWAEQVQQQQVGWNAMLNPAGLVHFHQQQQHFQLQQQQQLYQLQQQQQQYGQWGPNSDAQSGNMERQAWQLQAAVEGPGRQATLTPSSSRLMLDGSGTSSTPPSTKRMTIGAKAAAMAAAVASSSGTTSRSIADSYPLSGQSGTQSPRTFTAPTSLPNHPPLPVPGQHPASEAGRTHPLALSHGLLATCPPASVSPASSEASSPISSAATRQAGSLPAGVRVLLQRVNLTHCASGLASHGVTLRRLASMSESEMQAVGLATPQSRQLVVSELRHMGLRQ